MTFDVMTGCSGIMNPNYDIEMEVSKIADTAINTYKMLVEE